MVGLVRRNTTGECIIMWCPRVCLSHIIWQCYTRSKKRRIWLCVAVVVLKKKTFEWKRKNRFKVWLKDVGLHYNEYRGAMWAMPTFTFFLVGFLDMNFVFLSITLMCIRNACYSPPSLNSSFRFLMNLSFFIPLFNLSEIKIYH